eukprot:1780035-Lingulodinium_polyedra.AAC.1
MRCMDRGASTWNSGQESGHPPTMKCVSEGLRDAPLRTRNSTPKQRPPTSGLASACASHGS